MKGKFGVLWKSRNIGSLSQIIEMCVRLNLAGISLKIGDAAGDYYRSFEDMPAAVAAFRAAGIWVAVWHYVYGGVWINSGGIHTNGASPEAEAAFALRQIELLKPDAYFIDAEREWKLLGQSARAVRFMRALGRPDCQVGLNSYRFPSLHREFPWQEFLTGCNFHAPQVYHGPGRAVLDLNRSVQELSALKRLPFIPLGRAYIGDGHPDPKPQEITEFFAHCRYLGVQAASFWALDFLKLHQGGQARADAIAAFPWPVEPVAVPIPAPEPEPTPGGLVFRALVEGQNIRRVPVAGGVSLGKLKAGELLTAEGVGGPDAWIKTDRGWIAVNHGGKRYLEKA